MSFDVDRQEVADAVARGDVDWLWSALQGAYADLTDERERCERLREVVRHVAAYTAGMAGARAKLDDACDALHPGDLDEVPRG